uniref:Uncharacterized protein n=1 Tax=Sphenodon punctatus TaxID=8508 RepID=A0A8D0GKZ6_SPHPU
MEIKEERTSEEAQHFLPPTQADSLVEPRFTSIQKTANEPKLEFSLGKTVLNFLQIWQIRGILCCTECVTCYIDKKILGELDIYIFPKLTV